MTEEELLIKIIEKIVKEKQVKESIIFLPRTKRLSLSILYFLIELITNSKKANPSNLWIDSIEWKSLDINKDNTIIGNGDIWWGNKNNVSKMFSEEVKAKIKVVDTGKTKYLSYKFEFQIGNETYNFEVL
jgi:hypothetical protein